MTRHTNFLSLISVNLENDLARCYENKFLMVKILLCAEHDQSLLMMAAPRESMALATGNQENLQQNTNMLGVH